MAIACYDSNGQVASHEASIDHSTSFFQPVANEQHQPLASSPTGIGWTVSTLIQNAAYSTGRRHPQEVLAACEAGTTLAGVSPPISGNSTVQQPQGFAYMSVPTNHSTETAVESPSLDAIAGTAAAPWPHGSAQMPGQLPDFASVDNAAHSLDLFEELAMLERTDSSQHPQFLQNLGFLPDLDLAEFFGADYQPSDPHLAYMQPSVFSNMPSSTGDGGADIG
ncbi:hypothetical protein B0A55_07673 [Friedmanniomyces simplex]|uniref:Uncharacterized protein n=1 Tax=Friedmanniomyces simplex TaxID=329884 RepID=A0A4U0XAL7_9PEZI|nr:hypothetical protein B0A55_07673 [Friedmanniomyces simplex]